MVHGADKGCGTDDGVKAARHQSCDSVAVGRVAMNVLVVDDQPLARQVLRHALDCLPDIACVGECGRRDEAVAMILTVRDGQGLRLLDSNQVEWIESAGNYVHVHSGGRTYVIRTTMDPVARRLAADTFLRVRRTALVNTRSVAKIERYGKGTYVVHLRSGAQVITGGFYQAGLRRLLQLGA